MERAGTALAGHLVAGDVVSLDGQLGAGKTTMVRGLARGLGVAGQVSSPTFVIARRHGGSKSDLVHCDAYRIGGEDEFADLGRWLRCIAVGGLVEYLHPTKHWPRRRNPVPRGARIWRTMGWCGGFASDCDDRAGHGRSGR